MDIKDPNLHLKLQEMCDCYLDTSYEEELNSAADITEGEEPEESAVKYLALAIMYGITEKAHSLKLKKKRNGQLKAVLNAEQKIYLPPPSKELFDRVKGVVSSILHFEEGGGELPLSLGLRTGQVNLNVKLKEEEDKASLKLKFPQWS
ncbi:MAG: hypothetical protein ACLFV2_05105 [Desulfurivibrionaceae bacterium]